MAYCAGCARVRIVIEDNIAHVQMKKWRGIHLGDVWFDVTSFPADMPVRAAAKE